MTPQEFIKKWAANERTERAASQSHFNDLCELLGHPKPLEDDPTGERFTFDKGATKLTGGDGWADVWKKHCFAWEYKGKHADLIKAYAQLKRYADALDNPPLLIVSDMRTIIIHTAFTNAVKQTHTISLSDLEDPANRQLLRNAFTDPEKLRPGITRHHVTTEAAKKFSLLARRLQDRGFDPQKIAHFLDRLVFCMFAEDVGILKNKLFEKMVRASAEHPETFAPNAASLFRAMADGGVVAFEKIDRFNGGLFDTDETLPLDPEDIQVLVESAALDWASIEPAIFGTLFERGLDPDKRSQQGAHYTDPDTIMKIVRPVVVEPWEREWEAEKPILAELINKAGKKIPKKASDRLNSFLERLRTFKVLDPACGSGNFLYLSLRALKNFERRVVQEAEVLGFPPQFLGVGPQSVLGIEINAYAAELARISIWIGELQWDIENGFEYHKDPILRPLNQIECRDAIIKDDGTEADWPKADAIVGNPPFLGDKKLLRGLGREYVRGLRECYAGRLPGGADLCCYWFEKLRAELSAGRAVRGGLVATDNIRSSPKNRHVLEVLCRDQTIFEAWTDQDWINEGAAVRVSLIICRKRSEGPIRLNGAPVQKISSDLSPDPTAKNGVAKSIAPLAENSGKAFSGITKKGAFEIAGDEARKMLLAVAGPHGRKNFEVLFPWKNGDAITGRDPDMWIISFGEMDENEAAMFTDPFNHVREHVYPMRAASNSAMERRRWWQLARRAPDLFAAIRGLNRVLVTPEVSKHRVFAWLTGRVIPDKNLVVIARDDDVSFGVLQSIVHSIWALRVGTRLEDRPRYTSTTTFRTFPFPVGLTPNIAASDYWEDPRAKRIAVVAKRLHKLRENWLNPDELVDRVPEVVAGYPDRVLAKNASAAAELKKRTLTKLYNENPVWLQHVHRELDEAVAAAYGWEWPLLDEEVLSRLFKLNQERAAAGQ